MNIFQQREQILANLIEACKDHDEEKTNHLLNQLTELDKTAEQKPLPEEPKEQGFYVTANDGRLLLKENGGRQYAKWPEVCAQLPPEAFPLKRVNTGSDDD